MVVTISMIRTQRTITFESVHFINFHCEIMYDFDFYHWLEATETDQAQSRWIIREVFLPSLKCLQIHL